jgi:hypothetical protein
VNCKRLSANCKVPPVTTFVKVVHLGGERTRLRRDVKNVSVTSHQKLRIGSLEGKLSAVGKVAVAGVAVGEPVLLVG